MKQYANEALILLAVLITANVVMFVWLVRDIPYTVPVVLGSVLFLAALWIMAMRMARARLAEHQQTTEALKASEKQAKAGDNLIRSLLRNVPAGVIVYGSDQRVQFVNGTALDLLDAGDGKFVGKKQGETGWRLFDLNGRPLTDEEYPVNRVFAGEKTLSNELFSLKRKGGETNYILVTAFQIQGDDQGVMVVSTFIDVTERILAERRLRENENFSRAILNSIGDGVIACDEHDLVTHFNPAAQRMIGLNRDDAIGRPLGEVFEFQEDRVSSNIAFSQGYVTGKSGDATFVELLTAELVDRNGQHLGNVLTFRDMGEQLRIEKQRSTLDKMASVGVLAGGIAHDFNNLLVGLYGNVSLAQAAAGDNAEAQLYLAKAMESLERSTRLTKQLLTFATGSDPVRRQTPIEPLVREVAKFSMSGSSIAVEYDFAPDLWDIEADRGQIYQALSAVIINAKQAMGDRGRVNITVTNRYNMARSVILRPGSYVEIVIEDNGPGITADVQSRIFDPYFSTREKGTGLGLATTHSIIAKHGGTISVDSKPGEGAKFTIYLPAVSPADVPEIPAAPTQDSAQDSRHILVLDDEEIVLETLGHLLAYLGHRMVAVRDGAEAIRVYGQHFHGDDRFDCVIADLTIVGGMGGSEAAAGILEIDPKAILIVSSGYSDGAEMANYEAFGFTDVLEKPFDLESLKRTIARSFATP